MNANYRPWLDGVRAVAVTMVVIEHSGIHSTLNLGGTGVGIFFALSGYLITGLLYSEIDQTGSIILRRFYLRRFARLMPALVALVVIGDAFFIWYDAQGSVLTSVLALTYLTNYGTILRGHHLPGFGHTWSLAVEEHFYLIWPAVLLALSKRFVLRGVLKATLAICLGVLLWRGALILMHAPERMLYVGSLERADALLYGCAGAMLLKMGWRPPKALFYVGIALILIHLMHGVPSALVGSALLAIGSTLVVMTLDHCTLVEKRFLSWAPVVWIGVMSYGIYLWHGTLFSVLGALKITAWQAPPVVIALSVLMAYMSHTFLEKPVRDYFRSREQYVPPVARSEVVS
jgi:peptidoglycan/LPS O-acetylase OafA/YrhL